MEEKTKDKTEIKEMSMRSSIISQWNVPTDTFFHVDSQYTASDNGEKHHPQWNFCNQHLEIC